MRFSLEINVSEKKNNRVIKIYFSDKFDDEEFAVAFLKSIYEKVENFNHKDFIGIEWDHKIVDIETGKILEEVAGANCKPRI